MFRRHPNPPIPTDAELRQSDRHPIPKKILYPFLPVDSFYHLIMEEKLYGHKSGNSAGFTYVDGTNSKGKLMYGSHLFEVDMKGKAMDRQSRRIIRDIQSQTPIAVVLRVFHGMGWSFKIYTLQPNLPGQSPSVDQNFDGRRIYEFATCNYIRGSFDTTMITILGDSYRSTRVGSIYTHYRTIQITRTTSDGRHVIVCGSMKKIVLGGMGKNPEWELKISPGIDPVLMITYMALVNDLDG